MRNIKTIVVLLFVAALASLACSKGGTASLSQEEKYKLYYASTMTGDQAIKEDVIKRLGIGNGDSPIPNHQFFIAFIDWMKTDEGGKATQSINSPDAARDYLNQHLPK
jgi:hypothetical protein